MIKVMHPGETFSLTPLWIRPGGRTQAVLRNPPLLSVLRY